MSANATAPFVRTLIVSKSIDMAISTQSSRSLWRAIAVGSEEWSEHLQQRVGSFLRDPVSALGNDLAFDVVGNQPHGVGHALTEPFASADGEHGQRQLVRSEEHTSELQSLRHLVCRLLLEKKNIM